MYVWVLAGTCRESPHTGRTVRASWLVRVLAQSMRMKRRIPIEPGLWGITDLGMTQCPDFAKYHLFVVASGLLRCSGQLGACPRMHVSAACKTNLL